MPHMYTVLQNVTTGALPILSEHSASVTIQLLIAQYERLGIVPDIHATWQVIETRSIHKIAELVGTASARYVKDNEIHAYVAERVQLLEE